MYVILCCLHVIFITKRIQLGIESNDMLERAGFGLTICGLLMMFCLTDMSNNFTIALSFEKNIAILGG